MFKDRPRHQIPTSKYALFVVGVFFLFIISCYKLLNAPMNIMFLISYLFLYPAIMYLGYSYDEVNKMALDQIRGGLGAMLIIVSVGTIIASWIACGCVPAIIYYGLKIVSPKIFLLATFLLCLICSSVTGTSWGTAATVGLAMFTIGESMGVNAAMTVGAICSGSYFGDAISPISDGPSIISGSLEIDPVGMCRRTIGFAVPAAVVTGIIYWIMGLRIDVSNFDASNIEVVRTAIAANYHTGILAFIPLLLLLVLLFKKVPTLFSMLISAMTAILISVFYQGLPASKMFTTLWSGYSITSGSEFIDKLFNRGGVTSMSSTILLLLFAYGVVGLLGKSGILDALMAPLVKRAKSIVSVTALTELMSIVGVTIGTGGMAMIMTTTLMKPGYKQLGVSKNTLGSTCAATLMPWNAMIPWNSNGIYLLGLFGIPTLAYAKYFVFAYVILAVVIVMCAFGWNLEKESVGDAE